jgi:hypothetical protein
MANHAILATIARLSFRAAWTMPELPHEYTLRKKAQDDADYMALYEAIMRDGALEWWKGRAGRYLYPGDGWRYWHIAVQTINRNRIAERDKLIAQGLVSLTKPAKGSE